MPVLVDEAGQLIAGHGRVLAAKTLGLLDVPAMVARGWSEADNRRLAKDYENLAATLTTFVTLAAIRLGIRHLARA